MCGTSSNGQHQVKLFVPHRVRLLHASLLPRCNRDSQTKVDLNGLSQKAQFSFEAFRFLEHRNLTVSTFYLHCATRLCEVATCQTLLPVSETVLRSMRDWWKHSKFLSCGYFTFCWSYFQQNCTSPIRVRRQAQDVGLPNATVTSTFITVSSQANGAFLGLNIKTFLHITTITNPKVTKHTSVKWSTHSFINIILTE